MGDHIEKRSSRVLSSKVELHTNLEEFLGCLERNGYHKQGHNQRREGVMCLRYSAKGHQNGKYYSYTMFLGISEMAINNCINLLKIT